MSISERRAPTHFVNREPFDPNVTETLTPEQERYYMATQWQLMWWKLRRHRLAVISGAVLVFMYFSVIVSEILAPYGLGSRQTDFIYAPPQGINLFHDGEFIGPFVYGLDYQLNMRTLKRDYTANHKNVQPIRFFCFGDSYKFWGLFDGSFHLFCPVEGGTVFLLGTDRLGRDVLSRVIYGTRV
ncbi:MAG: ABC transporter permease, partial [Proteobacteria bacterium]|nr:ABC transporter permease [Pseudomonadota bacterium]